MNKGIIGFFDILGYQSLLENNPGDIASEIIDELLRIKDKMPEQMRKSFAPEDRGDKADALLSMLHWLVFSDTILLYTMFESSDDPGKRTNRWILMIMACLHLWGRMFQRGFPIRGVVHTGEFVVKGHCFGGRTIVEAYRMAQDYDLSICAFSADAFSLLIDDANSMERSFLWRHIPAQLFEYLAPRHSKEERSVVLNPLTLCTPAQDQLMKGDLAQIVHEAFWKHNKDIRSQASPKLVHTERYLRAAKAQFAEQKVATQRMMRFR